MTHTITSEKNHLHRIGTMCTLIGSVLAFFASITYFLHGNLMPHLDYNRVNSQPIETLTVLGVFVFAIALIGLVLSLFSFGKHAQSQIFYINFIVLGALLLALIPFENTVYNVLGSF